MKLLQSTHKSENPSNTASNWVVAPVLTIKGLNLHAVWKESFGVYLCCKKYMFSPSLLEDILRQRDLMEIFPVVK